MCSGGSVEAERFDGIRSGQAPESRGRTSEFLYIGIGPVINSHIIMTSCARILQRDDYAGGYGRRDDVGVDEETVHSWRGSRYN